MTLAGLPVDPGLCASCRYRSVGETRRGTTYLRCTAAPSHPMLPKYPTLPVLSCPAHCAGPPADRD